MKPSDLTNEQKLAILKKIYEQLGDTQFKAAVEHFGGVDGLLEHALQNVSNKKTDQESDLSPFLAIVVSIGVAYLFWKIFVYIGEGSLAWFNWLKGHF